MIGDIFGGVLSRVLGAPGRYLTDLYDEEEEQKAMKMSMDEMAEEALALKYKP